MNGGPAPCQEYGNTFEYIINKKKLKPKACITIFSWDEYALFLQLNILP